MARSASRLAGRFTRAALLAGAAATAIVCMPAGADTSSAAPVPRITGDGCFEAESAYFRFHSDPWINLHHLLYQWARNDSKRPAGDHRRPVEVKERATLADLNEQERQAWDDALGYYRDQFVGRRLFSDRDLIGLRDGLAHAGCGELPAQLGGARLREVLAGAMTVYRAHWWAAHEAANRAWIAAELKNLKTFEPAIAPELARAYGGSWPPGKVRVEVSAYANWAGAYTTNRPDQVTVSSIDYQGLEAVEILFHEVSHATFFEQKLFGALDAAFRAHGTRPPDRLAHMVQFVTPAALLRDQLDAAAADGYRSIADRLYADGPAAEQYRIVVDEWTPFLDGRASREQALDRIATALAGKH